MTKLVDAITFFDAIAERYDRDYALDSAETRARMTRIVREIAALDCARARVLDLGVGTGRELPALLDAGFDVTGVDASERMLEQCRKRARPIPLVACDFYGGVPFPDASFDAVLALHGTVAHPPSHEALRALVDEGARVLVSGGKLIVEAPSPAWLIELEHRPFDDGKKAARRVGVERTRHDDLRTRVAVEAVILGPSEWTEILGPRFVVSLEPLGAFEQLVIATRCG